MKKLLLMFAAVAAIAFVGCKTETKPAETTDPTDSVQVAADEYTVEGVTADLMKLVETGDEAQTLGFLDGIKAKADEFLKAGDNNKYFNIINILKTVWDANKDAIIAKIPTLADKMSAYIDVPEDLKAGFADFVANAAKEKAGEAVEAVKDAADGAVDAAAAKVEEGKEAVKDAAADAAQKTADAAQQAADKLK
ncbi:MAG: hypothetical protein IKW85_05190 [Muribaculaceae bacterium]|nr:hypothetical protein [Muribaculaceae bacterium]